MKVGLIGYPAAGKSTLYRAAARGIAKGDVTAVPVPDPRFDAIVAQVKPKKATPATVLLHDDLDDVQISGKPFTQKFLDAARRMDLLLHVVRGFDSPMAPYHVSIDPVRDQEGIEVELILADLQIVESRLEKLQRSQQARSPGSVEYTEKQVFERLKEPLENGVPLRNLEFEETEMAVIRNYQFVSVKPVVVAFNVGESEAASPGARIQAQIDKLKAAGTQAFSVCATFEEEVTALDAADQMEFLSSAGLSSPASDRVVRAVYDGLGLITFFTAGESETKAWPLRRGSNAVKAAGTIHTDIAKGFIRAEVTHYADYAAAGSMDAAYAAGKMSLEGKEYVVQDGDLLNIRNKA